MNEPKQSVDPVTPPQGRPSAWWKVRPVIQVVLVAEILAVVALLNMDATAAAVARAWFRPMVVTIEQVQGVLTALAVASVIAVGIEGVRKWRLAPRRNPEALKAASA